MKIFQALGAGTLAATERLGRMTLFLLEVLSHAGMTAKRFVLVVQQLYSVGVFTLPIVLVSGLFVGMVLGLQLYNTLVKFGAAESLGLVLALSLLRELGPVAQRVERRGGDRIDDTTQHRPDESHTGRQRGVGEP